MHFTQSGRVNGRGSQRGFSLIEIVVAIAIIAIVSAGATVAVVNYFNKSRMTETNAQTIRHAIKGWWLQNDSSTCPDLKTLVADGAIDRGKKVQKDEWGEPWRIICEPNDVTVISKGPDKKSDTEDDIKVPSL